MLGLSFCCKCYPVQDMCRSLIFGPVSIKQLTFFTNDSFDPKKIISFIKSWLHVPVYLNEFDFNFLSFSTIAPCIFRQLAFFVIGWSKLCPYEASGIQFYYTCARLKCALHFVYFVHNALTPSCKSLMTCRLLQKILYLVFFFFLPRKNFNRKYSSPTKIEVYLSLAISEINKN